LERDPTPSRFRRRAADADIYFTNPILFSSPLRFPNNKMAIVTDTGLKGSMDQEGGVNWAFFNF
jgi:hypothetical protein